MPGPADPGSNKVREKLRPKAKDAKERSHRRRPSRPVPTGHHKNLADQIEDPNEYGVRTYGRKKRERVETEEPADEALSEELTARIMKEARLQQEEIAAEGDPLRQADPDSVHRALGSSGRVSDSEDEQYSDDEEGGAAWDDGEVEISPEDEQAMAAFRPPASDAVPQRTLADIIMEKIRAQQQQSGTTAPESQLGDVVPAGMDPRVVAVYKGVGELLRRYTTGKIPKAFKIIPNLREWEEVLFLTDVPNWSPHAVYQATRLFISSLKSRLAQRFVAIVLLPHVRKDIGENKRLHFALFQSLKKACFKPEAFYKGFLLPLCAEGNCTLREAVIVSAVLRRVSLPVLHSSAVLLRIADMEYSGTNSFFIQVLLNKKYALPYRVVDSLVDHFARSARDDMEMPVVWHQSLLVFLQRYKHEVRDEDRPVLKDLLRRQFHYQVTPECHRELDAARARGEAAPSDSGPTPNLGKGEDPRNLAPVVLMDED